MAKIGFGFSLTAAFCLLGTFSLQKQAIAQGIGEMGGAYGMSSTLHPQAGAASGVLKGLYGSAAGAISRGAGGGSGSGSGSGGGGHVGMATYGGVNLGSLDSLGMVRAGAQANQMYVAAQKAEKKGDLKTAAFYYQGSFDIRSALWGDKDPAVRTITTKLVKIYDKLGWLPQEEQMLRKTISSGVRLYGAGAYELCNGYQNLAKFLVKEKKYAEATSNFGTAAALVERKEGISSKRAVELRLGQAKSLEDNDDNRAALDGLEDVLRGARDHEVTTGPWVKPILGEIISLCQKLNRPERQTLYQSQLDAIIAAEGSANSPAAQPAVDGTSVSTSPSAPDAQKSAGTEPAVPAVPAANADSSKSTATSKAPTTEDVAKNPPAKAPSTK